jgi:hypothetical protein
MKRIPLALASTLLLACASEEAQKSALAPPASESPAPTPRPNAPAGSEMAKPREVAPAQPAAQAPPSVAGQAPARVSGQAQAGSELGPPLVVYGETIPETELKRYMCLSLGSKQTDSAKFLVVVRNELDRRKEAGEDISKYEVTDADIERALEKQRKDFLQKYPTLDFPTEVGRVYLSLDMYKHELRQVMLFDRIFMPDDPETWPPLTTEAIVNATGGHDFVDDAKDSYQQRKKMMEEQNLPELPPDDPIFTEALRGWVLEALNSFAVTVTDPAKLPPGALLTVDGVPVMIDPLYERLRPFVTPDLTAKARLFLAQTKVTERDLAAQQKLMTREEFEETFMPGFKYHDAIAAYEMLALTVMGFPSMESYASYERLARSYRRVIDDKIKDDELMRQWLPRANQISGAARINAEVILCSAYDYDHVRWKPNGWTDAEAKAKKLKADLDGGANWADVLELHSEFWDPPMPEVGQKPQFGFRFKGRFGEQTRNQLLGDLDESDYTIFLTGESVADRIFFDQQLGAIDGPFKGQRGYYISRVISRTPPMSSLNMSNAKHREFLVDHYVKATFGEYSRGLLKKARDEGAIQGL